MLCLLLIRQRSHVVEGGRHCVHHLVHILDVLREQFVQVSEVEASEVVFGVGQDGRSEAAFELREAAGDLEAAHTRMMKVLLLLLLMLLLKCVLVLEELARTGPEFVLVFRLR